MAEKKVVTKTVTTEHVVHKKPAKKKVVKKKPGVKKKGTKKNHFRKKSASVVRVEKQLMENFVSLQKVLTQLSGDFNSMNKRLSDFLELFEDSAKAFVKTSSSSVSSEDNWQKEITAKMDSLFEQNRVIARGLTLIHDETLNARESMPVASNSGVRAEDAYNIPRPKGSGEHIRLNNRPRVKEEPDFDIKSPPFSLER